MSRSISLKLGTPGPDQLLSSIRTLRKFDLYFRSFESVSINQDASSLSDSTHNPNRTETAQRRGVPGFAKPRLEEGLLVAAHDEARVVRLKREELVAGPPRLCRRGRMDELPGLFQNRTPERCRPDSQKQPLSKKLSAHYR